MGIDYVHGDSAGEEARLHDQAPTLNAASSPAAAAAIYVTDFERAGIPAAGNREAAAEAVASACGI